MPSAPFLLLHHISLFCLDPQNVGSFACDELLNAHFSWNIFSCVLLFVFWFFLFRFVTKVRTIGASSKAGIGNGISTVLQVHCSELWQLSESCRWPLRQVQHHHSQHTCPKQSKIVVVMVWLTEDLNPFPLSNLQWRRITTYDSSNIILLCKPAFAIQMGSSRWSQWCFSKSWTFL